MKEVQMAGTKHNQPTKPFADLPMSVLETISNHFVTVRQTALHPIIECFNKAFRTLNDLMNSVMQASLPLSYFRCYSAIG
jgi:hypothetical protein